MSVTWPRCSKATTASRTQVPNRTKNRSAAGIRCIQRVRKPARGGALRIAGRATTLPGTLRSSSVSASGGSGTIGPSVNVTVASSGFVDTSGGAGAGGRTGGAGGVGKAAARTGGNGGAPA